MAIGRIHAVAIPIVEKYVLLRQGMVVGRNLPGKDAKRRVAVALRQVAQHLVVGPVLLDDVHHVFEYGWLAQLLRHGRRGRVAGGLRPFQRAQCLGEEAVACHRLRIPIQLVLGKRDGNALHHPVEPLHVPARLIGVGLP